MIESSSRTVAAPRTTCMTSLRPPAVAISPRAVIGNGSHSGPMAPATISKAPVTRGARLPRPDCQIPMPNAMSSASWMRTTAVTAGLVGAPIEPSSLMVCENGHYGRSGFLPNLVAPYGDVGPCRGEPCGHTLGLDGGVPEVCDDSTGG